MRFRARLAAWLALALACSACSAGETAATTTAAPSTTTAPPTTAPPATSTTTPQATTTSDPAAGTTAPPTTTTAPPTTTTTTFPVWWREVTPDAPLRVWVIGDSLTPPVGTALRALGTASGLMWVSVEAWGGTGLARPDIFDWSAFIDDNPPPFTPDVVVVLLGANDGQGMASPAGWLEFGTPEWDARYATLVAGFTDQLLALSLRVYWVGQPIMGGPNLDSRMRHISQILREQAALSLEARFIEAYSVLQGEDGGFAADLPDAQGNLVAVRSADGIHLTAAGGERVAKRILEELAADWRLPDG